MLIPLPSYILATSFPMLFNKYLKVLDQLDNKLPSATILSKPKLDPIAASAQDLAAHIDQLYQFNENHKLNGKDKDGLELMSLSLLNVVAEMVNIPLATSEHISQAQLLNLKPLCIPKTLLPLVSLMTALSIRPFPFLLAQL
jgi:hypothetical protein